MDNQRVRLTKRLLSESLLSLMNRDGSMGLQRIIDVGMGL